MGAHHFNFLPNSFLSHFLMKRTQIGRPLSEYLGHRFKEIKLNAPKKISFHLIDPQILAFAFLMMNCNTIGFLVF